MKRDNEIHASFNYLRGMAESQELFTLSDLANNSGWTEETANTYITKKFSKVVIRVNDMYKVDRRILSVPYDRYAALFKQKRQLFVEYAEAENPDVTVFEFFLPLTLEPILRQALDELFYKDTVKDRLLSVGLDTVSGKFAFQPGGDEKLLLNRVCEFVGRKFGGYSISHVSGRFRRGELLSKADAQRHEKDGESYIIDETTAIVRFIVPHTSSEKRSETTDSQLELPFDQLTVDQEIELTEWIFRNVFVEAVLQATTDQDEIWLLESGRRCKLYRFTAIDREE